MSAGSTMKKAADGNDWSRFDDMTDEQRHAAALADPDAQPWTAEQLARATRRPRALTIRRAMKLSLSEFGALLDVTAETVAGWESGQEPGEQARIRLEDIAREASLRYRGQRGPQKTPVKTQITLRLDPDVVEHYRATGEGWQRRINDALRRSAQLDR